MSKKAYLEYDGKKIALPVIIGTENEVGIDISKLRSKTGLITLDKGFKNTGSTTSSITYLNGEKVGDGFVGKITCQLLRQYNEWIVQNIAG